MSVGFTIKAQKSPVSVSTKVYKAHKERPVISGQNLGEALLQSENGRYLVARSKELLAKERELQNQINLSFEDREREIRIESLKNLVDYARIPKRHAMRWARRLGYLGGEDYNNAAEVLRHACANRESWLEALSLFDQPGS